GDRRRHPDRVRLEHRDVRRAPAPWLRERAAGPGLDGLPARCRADRLRPVDGDGRRPAPHRVRRHVPVAALLAWSARPVTAVPRSPVSAPPVPARRPLVSSRQLTNIVSHAYIWICLVVFVLPFLALLSYAITGSSTAAGSTYALKNFQNALGTFSDN